MSRIWRAFAAVLLLTLTLVLPAAPAAAAVSQLATHLGGLTLAPGGGQKLTLLWLRVASDSEAQHHFAVSLDYSKVAGFASVDLALAFDASAAAARSAGLTQTSGLARSSPATTSPSTTSDACAHSGTVISCAWDWYFPKTDLVLPIAYVVATPTDDATDGDEGTVTVAAKIDDDTTAGGDATIQVGTPVDLAAGAGQEIPAAPGANATISPSVSNPGTTAVDGAVLVMDASSLLGTTSYSNCRYGDDLVTCTFDDTIAAGSTYTLAQPFTLTPPADSIAGSVNETVTQWLTGSEYDDYLGLYPDTTDEYVGKAGTGAALELTESTSAAAQDAPQSDINSENDAAVYQLTVSGSGTPDLAAVGAKRQAAKIGDEVDIEVGLRNKSSGTLHPELYANNAVTALVQLPANTSALAADSRCAEHWYDGDRVEYLCTLGRSLAGGSDAAFAFALLVEKRRGTAGTVTVSDALSTTAASSTDNTAKITITAAGSDAGLPITGPDAVKTAFTGLALVVVGLLLTVRPPRRRVGAHAFVVGAHAFVVGAHAGGNRARVKRHEGSAR